MKTYVVVVGMLVFGALNTISTKWADRSAAVGIDGTLRTFSHPFVQAQGMFFGEILCGLAFLETERRRAAREKVRPTLVEAGGADAPLLPPAAAEQAPSPLLLLPPALCDLASTGLMYVGLALVDASVFQMLRGSVVVWTALLSKLFLDKTFLPFQYASIFLVVAGTLVVGYAGTTERDSKSTTSELYLGTGVVLLAQLVGSVQYVLEERFLGNYDLPALALVGYEGSWGALASFALLVALYNAESLERPENAVESVPDAFAQMGSNGSICAAVFLNMVSIAAFNFCGVMVTKAFSSSHRTVLDALRTVLIWVFAVAVGWESFGALQLLGFSITTMGTLGYNEVFRFPGFSYAEPPAPFYDDDEFEEGVDSVEESANFVASSGALDPVA